jgi:hypothetical protein
MFINNVYLHRAVGAIKGHQVASRVLSCTANHVSYASFSTSKSDAVIKNDWTRDEIAEIYNRPLINLIFDAATVHRKFHDPQQVQKATLLSIKTGGM